MMCSIIYSKFNSFNKVKYPIFYIPFSVEKQGDSLHIEFDSQVYINKKALEYITQEYNLEKEKKGNLKTITERIIYLANCQNNFRDVLSEILSEVTNFFGLDKNIDLNNPNWQISKSYSIKISNACYIALFDKSDEALVNDYEEILELLDAEDDVLAGAFNKLIDDFIYKNPQPFNPIVEDEWDNLGTSDRLVFSSPIPLNSEQLQILSAIRKKECKYTIVEGPPGTGKSHTITAIVFNSVLENQSVLVLSDKKEALDVVEDKIAEAINKVRPEKNFQNPILRLGKTGSTYSQILAPSSIENIKANFRAVKKDYDTIETNIEKSKNSLKEDLEAEIVAYSEIDIKEVYELIALELYFDKNGFPIDISETNENQDVAGELEDLRSILTNLKLKLNDYDSVLNPCQERLDILVNNVKWITAFLEKFINDYEQCLTVDGIQNRSIEIVQNDIYSFDMIYTLLGIKKPKQFTDVNDILKVLLYAKKCIGSLYSIFGTKLSVLSLPATFSDFNQTQIQWFIKQYESLKIPILGYLFRGKQVEELNTKFKETFKAKKLDSPRMLIKSLKEIKSICDQIAEYKKDFPSSIVEVDLVKILVALIRDNLLQEKFNELLGVISAFERFKTTSDIIHHKTNIETIDDFINKNSLSSEIKSLKKYSNFLETITVNLEDITYVISLLNRYPKLAKQSKIDETNIKTFIDNELLKISDIEWTKLIRYLELRHKIKRNFTNLPLLNYTMAKKSVEELVTAQMTYFLDGRLIDFYVNDRSTAQTLRQIIRSKRRFPKKEFLRLKEAFPCILAGIRDYAEYVPLEPEIFDLVIIDEASQVSIAQAFPALLRAKQVVIFGDRKQFSNVKSAQARTDTNKEYLSKLKDCFVKFVSDGSAEEVKLEKFNIKTSILEFFAFISNFNIRLLKHFRGYKEIISYSNKYFYQGDLQVMKIRGKAIDEVLKFSLIKHDDKKELVQNTNVPEVEFIISELKKIKESASNVSVGIITPHTNQQKLLVERIDKVPEKDYFYDMLRLKIMTFDTCQGEERDIIFYSMVATEEDDRLWGVFIKDLNDVNIEEEEKIKAQRLNVGLSRARECIHFVLSKPIDKFSGSIGEALRHYALVLNEAKKERSVTEADQKSKMEPEVMNWFYQTDFWKKNRDCKPPPEFIPQFELGKYLKQLDKTYNHPDYKVDFLLVYKDEMQREHKIIIEYDGFREHFKDIEWVNKFNWQNYYTDSDVYREKVIESYGYKFLRINRFNVGNNPILTLNEQIENLIKNGTRKNDLISHIHETIEGLNSGEMRECPKCKKIKDAEDFKDPNLITGYGRFCNQCKGLKKPKEDSIVYDIPICPNHGVKMILKNGRYGKFYGCPKFPYCRITRDYKSQK